MRDKDRNWGSSDGWIGKFGILLDSSLRFFAFELLFAFLLLLFFLFSCLLPLSVSVSFSFSFLSLLFLSFPFSPLGGGLEERFISVDRRWRRGEGVNPPRNDRLLTLCLGMDTDMDTGEGSAVGKLLFTPSTCACACACRPLGLLPLIPGMMTFKL